MTDNNNWPGKPGVPLNPERDGWHWVNSTPREWVVFDDGGSWRLAGSDYRPHEWAHRIYQGPCLTPAEVDARVKEARRDALEEAAQEMDCACPQRGAVLEKLAKDGPLSHYWPCEKGDDCCALRGAAIRALKGEGDE